ncbi:MAG TPA: ParB/RepB/Spo0J family partition protein [Syntrophomonadaceae bacterium]|nr:ParB/RepB/Spo0J family partition protein [Syntrophomonadaceae bacterium]
MSKKPRGLGRGLDALFSSSDSSPFDAEEISSIDIQDIIVREDQPRKNFDPNTLEELAKSIKDHGLLQAILVRPLEDKYEIVAGERRYRAAKLAGLESLPVVIKEVDDQEAFEIALIENLQREDLSIIEEAEAYKSILDKFGYTQEVLAGKVGKSRAHITNSLRILNLPEEILQMLENKEITAGHARTLLSLPDKKEQLRLAQQIVEEKISVRETEQKTKTKGKKTPTKAVEILELEDILQKHLATKAEITPKKKGGSIQISYYDAEDFKRILELLGIILK